MKRLIVLTLFSLMIFSIPVESRSKDLKFVIVYDSREENMIEQKKEIVDLINSTLENVDQRSYYDFLKYSVSELENENRKVYFYFSTIYFYLGDHQGVEIKGDILQSSFCMVEVKPKSFIRQWFNF